MTPSITIDKANADVLLTVHEVARQLRVDDTTVRRWIKNGSLSAVTLPHAGKRCAYRVRQSTLDEILATASLSPDLSASL